jgi:hypothetical protein
MFAETEKDMRELVDKVLYMQKWIYKTNTDDLLHLKLYPRA